jgi:hypothetical protein
LLIVCEGEKTEPQYLNEIRQAFRLMSAHVQVQPSALGTAPIQVVGHAERLFNQGDSDKGIVAKAFDRVFVVFDRDEHPSYHAALSKVQSLDKHLLNSDGRRVPFRAIASVPCFELWLLLHFEEVQAPIQRQRVYQLLRQYLPAYDKGKPGCWASTRHLWEAAAARAVAQAATTTAHDGQEPYTDMHELVSQLVHLKD